MMVTCNLEAVRAEFRGRETGPLGLDEYQGYAVRTYRGHVLGVEKLRFLLLGLFGETGSLLSELKKKQRDRSAYTAYESSAREETGDVLWYLANVAAYCGWRLSELATHHGNDAAAPRVAARSLRDLQPGLALDGEPASPLRIQTSLLTLAGTVGTLIAHMDTLSSGTVPGAADGLAAVLSQLITASDDAQIDLADAALTNLGKLLARWPQREPPPWGALFDTDEKPWEQLPRQMSLRFDERRVGTRLYVFQTLNGVHLGDRLTDNNVVEDDYRFHDVFHLAFAAILGWSPVLRSLLRVKRKSRPDIDEHQDGARAAITEEGISNWVFAHGLRHEAFAHVDSLDFGLLRTIAQMVRGYEVEIRPLWMWERAILEGFRVFRLLRTHRGGIVTTDLLSRTLTFEENIQGSAPSDAVATQ